MQTPKRRHKYVFVVGGVMSGVGKGITVSSIGTLLSGKGLKVNLLKVDPYLNVDAGTMNPTEHGEVFVLNSGLETDQDMGNYERFLGRDLSSADYMTSGMVYQEVIEAERALKYGGKCVEAIPHIRDEIIRRFKKAADASQSDISIIEIGGTIGDYQNAMFLEAARTLKSKCPEDVAIVMVSYLPTPSKIGEMKTRPTQHAVRELASYGINTDIIICRADTPIDSRRKEKIAAASNISPERVISAPDIESIYDVPENFEKDGLDEILLKVLSLTKRSARGKFDEWKKFARRVKSKSHKPITIGMVGKYFATGDFVLTDAYLSVLEALKFSGAALGVKVKIKVLNAQDFEKRNASFKKLDSCHGILVPGGFGATGIEGKINVIQYARENKIPYFGLCYGMQLMVIEYARNVLKLKAAHTEEVNPASPHLLVAVMEDQKKNMASDNYGGSMRLGTYPARLKKGTVAWEAYGKDLIDERHRHRYEVNNTYRDPLEKAGLTFSGTSPDDSLAEIAELNRKEHPFFLGTQFHPEFLARPLSPHPLFTAFLKAAKKRI